MIPEREDSWLGGGEGTATSDRSRSSTTDPSIYPNQPLDPDDPDADVVATGWSSAWQRYYYYVQLMQASGSKFNQRLAIEAMFRGSDLVYSPAPSADCTSSSSPSSLPRGYAKAYP